MTIRITASSSERYWYASRVGESFEVLEPVSLEIKLAKKTSTIKAYRVQHTGPSGWGFLVFENDCEMLNNE